MKNIIISMLLIGFINSHAAGQQPTFIRVFDTHGHKFTKGLFAGTTDSSLLIYSGKKIASISVTGIGYIKTKRSFGRFIWVSMLITSIPAALIGYSGGSDNPTGFLEFSRTETMIFGIMAGITVGTVIGTIIGVSKQRKRYNINGSADNWLKLRPAINQLPAYHYSNTGNP